MSKVLSVFFVVFLISSCSKTMPVEEVVIETQSGLVKYNMEIASTPSQLEKGLMHRETLASDAGMLFNINPARPAGMWMKNTIVSLDMVFVDEGGSVVCIAENTKPMSEDIIECVAPVRAVLEINAGEVAKHGVSKGDKVVSSAFGNTKK